MFSNMSDKMAGIEETKKMLEKIGTEIKTLDELKSSHSIALIANTGQYWSRWNSHGVRAAKSEPDKHCSFRVTFEGNDVLSLQADTEKYLTRWVEKAHDFIEELLAKKDERDQSCMFTVARDASDKGVTLKGDNNRYITLWGPNELRICKEQPDELTVFRLIHAKPSNWI